MPLIMIEASPLRIPQGYAGSGKEALVTKEGGDLRRCDTNQHPFSWGSDLQARSMSVCIVSHDGKILLHRTRQAAPAPCRKAVAPSREGLVVAVACRLPWDWLAALCADEGRPCV
jgi:hypothetical protein